jgi:isocitrate dehydrogenase
MYWAQAIAAQSEDMELAAQFGEIASSLADGEAAILSELIAAQGNPMDLAGYFLPSEELAAAAMRPSSTLNAIIDAV